MTKNSFIKHVKIHKAADEEKKNSPQGQQACMWELKHGGGFTNITKG